MSESVLRAGTYVGREWPSGLKPGEEVAPDLGLTPGRLRELADANLVPHWRVDGGPPLYKAVEVRRWLAQTAILTRCEGKEIPLTFVVSVDTPAPASAVPVCLMHLTKDLRDLPLSGLAPGIYFLCADREVLYVGQSVTPISRITSHRGRITFNRVFLYPCMTEHLNLLEGYFIRALKPPFNGNSGPTTDPQRVYDLYPQAFCPDMEANLRAYGITAPAPLVEVP